jgi:hypothetical protein
MLTNHTTVDTPHGIIDIYWTEDDIIVTWRDNENSSPLEIEVGSKEIRRKRVERILGDYEFNPYDRNPTDVEIENLEADGLTREFFENKEILDEE